MSDRIKAQQVKCRTTLIKILAIKDKAAEEPAESGKRSADKISGAATEDPAVKKEKSEKSDAKTEDAAVKTEEAAAPATEDTAMKTEDKAEVKPQDAAKDAKDASEAAVLKGNEGSEHAAGQTISAAEAGDGEKCPWVGTIETLGEHMKECQFRTVKCEQGHNAANKGCQEMVQKREIESHRKERCGFRKVPCKFCKKDYQVPPYPCRLIPGPTSQPTIAERARAACTKGSSAEACMLGHVTPSGEHTGLADSLFGLRAADGEA